MNTDIDQVISIIDDSDLAEDTEKTKLKENFSWHVLVVDDEQVVHDATEIALKHERIFDRPITLHHAYSAREGLNEILKATEYVVAFIDVVMEKEDAGLTLIHQIRELGLNNLRIILRTGQPGYAPELSVITSYDINDYRTKTELTKNKLISVLITAIRSYQQISAINRARKGLELIVNASSNLYQQPNVEKFGNGVLTQIAALLGKQTSGIVCITQNKKDGTPLIDDYTILCATGIFQEYRYQPLVNAADKGIRDKFNAALSNDIITEETGSIAMHISSFHGAEAFIYIDCDFELTYENIALLRIFGTNISAIFNNINLLEKLDEIAYKDSRTGIPNMNFLMKELESRLENRGSEILLILVHLDWMGKVFSLLGTHAVNRIITQSFSLISKQIPKAKIITRSSWGNFSILMNAEDYKKEEVEPLTSFSIRAHEGDIRLTSTIAVARSLPEDQKPDDIVQRANLTLILGKGEHRGEILEYDQNITAEMKNRLEIQYNLRESARNGLSAVEVYLQPKYDTLQKKIVGAEALSRWKMNNKFISPVVFIPILVESGFSMMLIEKLLQSLGQWHHARKEENQPPLPVSVNLSMKDIPKGGYAKSLLQMASKYQLTPDIIEFEITEGAMMSNAKQTIEELNILKSAGYRIAVDDFGTGYSSLSYLENLPIDILKIDRAFVSSLTPQNARRSIAATIVAMAESLDLEVIAEGIESEEQNQSLQFLGCNVCQGYLFGKPINMELFDSILNAN